VDAASGLETRTAFSPRDQERLDSSGRHSGRMMPLWTKDGVIVDWPPPQAGRRAARERPEGACQCAKASAKRHHTGPGEVAGALPASRVLASRNLPVLPLGSGVGRRRGRSPRAEAAESAKDTRRRK
jgi:hypothetical protein